MTAFVGSGVAVGSGVVVGSGVAVGSGVVVGSGVAVGSFFSASATPLPFSPSSAEASATASLLASSFSPSTV
ncbi:hypothetical protein LIP98_09745 [Blautia faecis]|nr:hypothetical protein [Blautia faecis]